MTFEDVPGGSSPGGFGPMPTYLGFNFNSTLNWIDVSPFAYNYGAKKGDFALLNNYSGVGIITEENNEDFTFDGLWAKAWLTAPQSGGPDIRFGTLEGFNDGQLVWSVDTALNGSYRYFAPQDGLIDELRLGFGNHFLVDELRLNHFPENIPEPSTLAIFTLSLLGLTARRFK